MIFAECKNWKGALSKKQQQTWVKWWKFLGFSIPMSGQSRGICSLQVGKLSLYWKQLFSGNDQTLFYQCSLAFWAKAIWKIRKINVTFFLVQCFYSFYAICYKCFNKESILWKSCRVIITTELLRSQTFHRKRPTAS